ncbi:MAG: carboxy terminal-processing peptidase [Imperialibacter sp.]|uniref:carboxy terminal-processing peptidase n=1 Tax=Imperialibacter sp. TaxID=2038411 RepID=UPI0032ED6347
MNKASFLWIALLFVLLGTGIQASAGKAEVIADTTKLIVPNAEHGKEALLITRLLLQNHYRKTPLNDSLSNVIFNNYITNLDNNRMYFVASDIEYFKRYKDYFDNYLLTGNIDVPFQMFRLYQERALDRISKVNKILETEPDFSSDEMFTPDREKEPWAKSFDELDELWRKTIKYQALGLKLEGKEWKDIKTTLASRYARYHKMIEQYNSEDAFQMFMNSFTEAFDPHTNYFSPITSENFQIDMAQSLEGIGARLTQQMDNTQVYEVIPGGPAYKSKQIYKDDKIVAVAQGDKEDFVDVIGWRLDDVVQLIRGPKGTVVRLKIVPHDAPDGSLPVELRLVRDKVKLEEETASKKIVPYTEGGTTYKLGVITLPSFYFDWEGAQKGEKDYKSATRDVKRLLAELEADGVDGVMMDLRFNGGGSLQEAINLSGLFISKGPVVQVKNADGSIDVGTDKDSEIAYNGPLAILVNRFSASASEIFAGAIQDYKRGIVIGENSFGKGTVQQLVDLDQFLPQETAKLGQVKLTLSKYYRVNGSSTQHLGVKPDIEFPSAYDADSFGESSQPSALPWDQIRSSSFTPVNKIDSKLIEQLTRIYSLDLQNNAEFKELQYDIEEAKKASSKNEISLNYTIRKAEIDDVRAARESIRDLSTQINDSEVKEAGTDRKEPKDVYLDESLKLLANLIKIRLG